MSEKYQGRDIGAPARGGFTTRSATRPISWARLAIYVGRAGDLVAVLATGKEVSFVGLGGRTVLPVRARGVEATGTSAGYLVALLMAAA